MKSFIGVAAGGKSPRWTWRTRLVNWFMRRGRAQSTYYTTLTLGVHSDGCLLLLVTTPDGEVITSCDMGPASVANLQSTLEETLAHRKLRMGDS